MFKKVIAIFALVLSTSVFAEASFPQVETMIENKQYEVASLALQEIINNHPNSAKAFYAMAQTQAGLGNLPKAQFALNKAKALDPELKFASSGNIASLEQAITPQTAKIEKVEESHFWRNVLVFLVAVFIGYFVLFRWILRKNDEDEGHTPTSGSKGPPKPMPPSPEDKVAAVNSQPLASAGTPRAYTPTPSYAPSAPAPVASAPSTTVVNNHYGSNNDGLLTGVLIGEMMHNNNPHYANNTTVVERDVYIAPPTPTYTAPSRSSSWDDDSSSSSSSSSRSSSWDSDDSSSKSSSSWSSSSSSSSSWDSDSSSSSSSWDSGSSSSDSGSSDW
jgi:hypothetical protein